MSNFSSPNLSIFRVGKRYVGEGTESDVLTDDSRPLSLTMSPTLIWLNATGNREAKAITAAWQPRFAVRYATAEELATW